MEYSEPHLGLVCIVDVGCGELHSLEPQKTGSDFILWAHFMSWCKSLSPSLGEVLADSGLGSCLDRHRALPDTDH